MKFTFPLIGNNYRPIECQVRARNLNNGDEVRLQRQPDNPYDPNAIQVYTTDDNLFIGFVPRKWASEMAGAIDSGDTVFCRVIDYTMPPTLEAQIGEHEPEEDVPPLPEEGLPGE